MSERLVKIEVQVRVNTDDRDAERAVDRLTRDIERTAGGRDYESLSPELRTSWR